MSEVSIRPMKNMDVLCLHRMQCANCELTQKLFWFFSTKLMVFDNRSHFGKRRKVGRKTDNRKQPTYNSITFGESQGSVLEPLLFLLYTADLLSLIQKHSLRCHLYADDTQVYCRCRPHDAVLLRDSMSICIDGVSQWTRSNRLQLNALKTENIWCAPARAVATIFQAATLRLVLTPCVLSSRQEMLVSTLTATCQWRLTSTMTLSSCLSALPQIRTIKRSLSSHAMDTLVTSLVHRRLDYCNVLFAVLPARDHQRLQSVMLLYDSSPLHQVAVMLNHC